MRRPFNLEVVPYPDTKVTVKEQMITILMDATRAEHTGKVFSYIPMSPLQHISGIEPII